MISLLLVILAAFFNAVMDRTKDVIQFWQSIFKNYDKVFWCDEYATSYVPHTRYKANAWHLSKSMMLVCFTLAIILYKPIINGFIDFAIIGNVWILMFNLFYNKVLKS